MRRFRLLGATLVVAALVATGCSDSDDEGTVTGGGGGQTNTTSVAATSPAGAGTATLPAGAGAATLPAAAGTADHSTCQGLGAPPSEGAITFVDAGRLLSVGASPSASVTCLLDGVGAGPALRWNGPADKVIMPDGRVVAPTGAADVARGQATSITWSYPTGTTVLDVDAGRLLLIPAGGGDPLDISFLARHDAAVYHPAGTHVVSSGLARDGTYGLWMATNRGSNVGRLVREPAISISNLVFTANDQLLFVADHGDHKDLHQMDLTTGKLVTAATIPSTGCFTAVVASRLAGGGVAWATAPCSGGTVTATAVRNGAFLPLAGTEMASAHPVGFLPDGTLVGRGAAGIITFRDGHVASISSARTGMVALRVVAGVGAPRAPGRPRAGAPRPRLIGAAWRRSPPLEATKTRSAHCPGGHRAGRGGRSVGTAVSASVVAASGVVLVNYRRRKMFPNA